MYCIFYSLTESSQQEAIEEWIKCCVQSDSVDGDSAKPMRYNVNPVNHL